jgi:phosphopantothenoylcysteine decarboxylase / phosphopantothenate---cysteine ligase
MWKGKKILLGISGSIAAYKSVYLVRALVKAGAEVKVVMTPSAKDFVSPLTLSTLSRNSILTDLFDENNWANHVMLGRWADVMLIAPLSCNTLAKMTTGQCDNLLMAVYLSATCPVVVAPAMDEDMWHHPITQKNLATLQSFGNTIIPVEKGELASGLFGDGRMAEPDQIVDFVANRFFLTKSLVGKKALVTAGPTYEAIDPVRFIGNHSSGRMGMAIAKELHARGAEVTLVLGPVPGGGFSANGIRIVHVVSAQQMYEASESAFESVDLAVMAAAVADYTPAVKANEKIKKKEDSFNIELTKTKDILKSLGRQKKKGQVLVGFALETNDEKANAKKKLEEKNADMIVLNSLKDEGAGFGHITNRITIFHKDGREVPFELKSKQDVAKDIVDTIINTYYV